MLTNLGIYASSQAGSRAPTIFSYQASGAPTARVYFTFLNGTAIVNTATSLNSTSNYTSGDIWTSSTAAGTSLNTTYGITAANGVVMKFGRYSAGTVAITRSTDGGQTWVTELNTASTGDYLIAGAYGDVSGTARWVSPVAGDNDVYLSTNNGDTWTVQSNVLGGTARTWCAATRFGTAFGVFADNTAYYTSETGVTWTLRTLPVAPGHESFRNFVAGSAEVMYLAATGGGTVVSYISTDLVNWSASGTVAVGNFDALNLAYGNGYWVIMRSDEAGVQDFVNAYYSASAGTVWTASSVTSGTGSFTNPEVADLAYNPTDGGFYMMAGGDLWRAITI